jgi:hypothetical protein
MEGLEGAWEQFGGMHIDRQQLQGLGSAKAAGRSCGAIGVEHGSFRDSESACQFLLCGVQLKAEDGHGGNGSEQVGVEGVDDAVDDFGEGIFEFESGAGVEECEGLMSRSTWGSATPAGPIMSRPAILGKRAAKSAQLLRRNSISRSYQMSSASLIGQVLRC